METYLLVWAWIITCICRFKFLGTSLQLVALSDVILKLLVPWTAKIKAGERENAETKIHNTVKYSMLIFSTHHFVWQFLMSYFVSLPSKKHQKHISDICFLHQHEIGDWAIQQIKRGTSSTRQPCLWSQGTL